MQEPAETKSNTRKHRRKGSNLWYDATRYLFRQRSAILGMVILGTMLLIAIFAPFIATHDPRLSMLDVPEEAALGVKRRTPPCIHLLGCPEEQPQHLLGLDSNVRDLFSRIIYGSRYSLYIGFASVGFAIVIGSALGATASYVGGWVDNVIMRVMDVLLAFPSLLLAIAIVTVLGPGLVNALLAIGIVSIPHYARVMRASVLSVKERDFVTADRALGVSSTRILFNRILPNAITPSDSTRDARHCDGHPGRGRPLLPGTGRAAADARVGHHAGRGAEPGLYLTAPGFLPRLCHHARSAVLQPAGRRDARCARPTSEPLRLP